MFDSNYKTFWSGTNVASNSDELVADLIAQTKISLKPTINYKQYTTPFYIVDDTIVRVPVTVTGKTGSTLHKEFQKGVPIPANAVASAPSEGDCHLTVFHQPSGKLWEFYKFKRSSTGQCSCSWGGIIEDVKKSNGVVQPMMNASGKMELTGASATSLPVCGGMIFLKELKAWQIPHMLAMAIPNPAPTFIAPALRTDGNTSTSKGKIPAGQIFKFPQDIVLDPKWVPIITMMVVAGRDYGMIVRDKSGCVNFYAEDVRQYGFKTDPYLEFFDSKPIADVMKQFPWSKLKAVNF